MVSGLNATDRMPMYEMPLSYVFRVLELGASIVCIGVFGQWHFGIGVLSRDHVKCLLSYQINNCSARGGVSESERSDYKCSIT